MLITPISDTHGYHREIENDIYLPNCNEPRLLIHAGDITPRGTVNEIDEFCSWYESLTDYDYKIFIAGNHDWDFIKKHEQTKQVLNSYKNIDYLQDNYLYIGDDQHNLIKIYGSPWQPRFRNWAFNADPGEDIKQHWNKIPNDTDILITHGPVYGILDKVYNRYDNLGCKDLYDKINDLNVKIHVCGHIHTGYGYYFNGKTHFFNASVLNEQYQYTNKPITFNWDEKTNKIEFI